MRLLLEVHGNGVTRGSHGLIGGSDVVLEVVRANHNAKRRDSGTGGGGGSRDRVGRGVLRRSLLGRGTLGRDSLSLMVILVFHHTDVSVSWTMRVGVTYFDM